MNCEHFTISILCGYPLSGKTETAKLIQKVTGMHLLDIDEIANVCIGKPAVDWEKSEIGIKQNNNRMKMAYELLHQVLRIHIEFSNPVKHLLLSATYSSISSWSFLSKTLKPYQNISKKVIWLRPVNDSPETIEKLLAKRELNYTGGCNSLNEYFAVKQRFEPPPFEYKIIDTWFKNTPEECAKQAIEYIF